VNRWLVVVTRRPSPAIWDGGQTIELAPLSADVTRALAEESASDLAMTDAMLEGVVARSGGKSVCSSPN